MEIILTQDVKNLGYKNDIVNVKPGYARNFLIPQGMAILATESARKVLAENMRQQAYKQEKIKKEGFRSQISDFRCQNSEFRIQLKETQDIAKALGESKRAGQKLIGFALETEHEKENALHKMERKHLDAIVLNSLRDKGAGFGVDTNRVTVLSANGNSEELPLQSKATIADAIIELTMID